MQHNSPNTAAEYIRSFQNGEENGFNFFFREYYAALSYFSFQMIKDRHEAEEIAGEALMKLWERRANFDNQAAIKSFLYTTARNASLNWIRQQKRSNQKIREAEYMADKNDRDAFQEMVEIETYREILMALKTLPPQCRKIFSMLFLEGKDYQQIAAELNLSIATIRSQKARALMLIKQRMAFSIMLITVSIFS